MVQATLADIRTAAEIRTVSCKSKPPSWAATRRFTFTGPPAAIPSNSTTTTSTSIVAVKSTWTVHWRT